MRNISINELSRIAAGLTFIGAVVYGYFHPEKC